MTCKVAMVSLMEHGGHPTYVREVITAIDRQAEASDLSIELLASEGLQERFRQGPYRIHPLLPSYPPRNGAPWLLYKFRQFIYPMRVDKVCLAWLRSHPEIHGVHFEDYFNLGSAFNIRAYRRTGKWLAFTVHNIRPHKYYPFCRTLMDAMARFTWRRCDALFVHTERLKADLSAFLGKGHPPIQVTPHGAFEPNALEAPRSLEDRLALRRLLFFGAVRENKGLHTVLDAMDSLEGFSLTIAGGIFAERAYWDTVVQPRIEALRAKGRTIEVMDSYIPEEAVHALWDAHSAVLLPYTDGFMAQSGVLFLAVGLETPIVGSAVGGLGATLRDHAIGEVMASNDPAGFADAVRNLYRRPTKDLEVCLKAARKELSWELNAERAIQTYQILEQHPRS